MKELNISKVPVDKTNFAWLGKLCEGNDIERILISEEQSNEIFSSKGRGIGGRWTHYRGIPLVLFCDCYCHRHRHVIYGNRITKDEYNDLYKQKIPEYHDTPSNHIRGC